jgi:copper transport protein
MILCANPVPFRCLRAAAFLIILGLGFWGRPGDAFAHAVLVSSRPAQGQRLASAPQFLVLQFSEAVSRVDATLVDRYRRAIKLETKISGNEVRAVLDKPLADGVYAFNWRVISEDGHPVSAAIVFAVGKATDMAGFPAAATTTSMALPTYGAKIVFYLTCMFGVGGAFFSAWIFQGRSDPATRVSLLMAGACALLMVGFLGAEETAGSLVALFTAEAWTAAIQSSLARSMALVGVSLSLAFVSTLQPERAKGFSVAALILLGPAFALTGHASVAGVRWLSFAAVSLHVIAVCFWAGALPGLWYVLGPGRPGQKETLSRFSAAIPLSVGAMLLAGGYLAYVQVGTPAALLGTDYGKVLLVKLALVGTALALGAWNRFYLTSRVDRGEERAARVMKAVVSAEILLIVLVLAATSLWRFTPPPRSLALQPPMATFIHIHGGTAMATVSFRTKPDLVFDAEIFLETAEFNPLDPREVTFRMSSVDGSVAAFTVPFRRVSPGIWTAQHIQAPCDCDWNVRIDALVSDFDQVTLNGRVKLTTGQ